MGADELHVRALPELDALVGEYIMRETPAVHWEDSYSHFQFESLDEAIDAIRDPVFNEFIPIEKRSSTVIQEVKEFRPYSSQLGAAWTVIEQLGAETIKIQRAGERWRVAFGGNPEVEAESPTVAICLAALKCRGVQVTCEQHLELEI